VSESGPKQPKRPVGYYNNSTVRDRFLIFLG